MKVKIIGDVTPDIDFKSIGYDIVDNGYDVVLSSFSNNSVQTTFPVNMLAMVLYESHYSGEEGKTYLSRTSSAKAVLLEGGYKSFYKKLYRLREGVFWCDRDHKVPEEAYKRMLDWVIWERSVENISLIEYTEKLKEEGISKTHCIYSECVSRVGFRGDSNWQDIRMEGPYGGMFTGFKPEVVEMPVESMDICLLKNGYGINEFIADPERNPKPENGAPSWKRLFHDIAKNGIENPVRVFKYKGGLVTLWKGKHRIIAAKMLGFKTIPSVVSYEI